MDSHELHKANPHVDFKVLGDAGEFPKSLICLPERQDPKRWKMWVDFAQEINGPLPLSEASNKVRPGFTNTYDFYLEMSKHLMDGDTAVPSSSGSAETVAVQALLQPPQYKCHNQQGLGEYGVWTGRGNCCCLGQCG